MRVVMVAEGSGGHLIPALEVAQTLAREGTRTTVWYARRPQVAALAKMLTEGCASSLIDCAPIPAPRGGSPFLGLWGCVWLFVWSRRQFGAIAPDVVVGFGGLVSVPVLMAARRARIPTLLHEQNVVLGRANRFLARSVDRIAVSCDATREAINGTSSVVTGMPVRAAIGRVARSDAAARLGLDPGRPTLLVLGGSQGSQAINRIAIEALGHYSAADRATWQVVHLTGSAKAARIAEAYRRAGLPAVVRPCLADMASAYAIADLVIGRAGASTIAELAQARKPSVLIPYPHAGGHQMANARLVERVGGGVVLEEAMAIPERVATVVWSMMDNARLREAMGNQAGTLATPDAADRLARTILEMGR